MSRLPQNCPQFGKPQTGNAGASIIYDWQDPATLTVTGSTFTRNTDPDGAISNDGMLTVSGSTFRSPAPAAACGQRASSPTASPIEMISALERPHPHESAAETR